MVIKGIDAGLKITELSKPQPVGGTKGATGAQSDGFTQVLGGMVEKVNNLQVQADKSIESFLTGESKGLHEVMIAVEKSSVSFQFLNQVRNKALDAYHEIMRMQV